MPLPTVPARFSLLLFAAMLGGCHAGGSERPRARSVAIEGAVYTPSRLEVAVGDTVVWTNRDLVPHTVTADAGAFDSGSMASGESWRYVATRTGNFPYGCRFHPSMKGMLVVR